MFVHVAEFFYKWRPIEQEVRKLQQVIGTLQKII